MKASEQAINLIKKWEGFRGSPYLCSADVPTIGFGTTFYPDGKRVKITDKPITESKALAFLKNDVIRFESAIDLLVQSPLQQCMFDALVSLVYNIGIERFKTSTLLRLLNSGDYLGASAEFPKWNKVKGQTSSGLVKRRKKEMDLFCGKNVNS